LHARFEPRTLPLKLPGERRCEDASAHENHQRREQHDRGAQVEGGGRDTQRHEHCRQGAVAPFLRGARKARHHRDCKRRGESGIRGGGRDALRHGEIAGARGEPQRERRGKAHWTRGAHLVAGHHGEGKAEQHFVGVPARAPQDRGGQQHGGVERRGGKKEGLGAQLELRRSLSLISSIARAGLRPLGHTSVQFMIVRQR
jgi:hypothetical protein